MRWISTSERLPDDQNEVLVYHALGDRAGCAMAYDVAAYIKGRWIFPWDRGLNPPPQCVTHWKKLEPPE